MTTTAGLAHAIVSMAQSRWQMVRQEIESDYVDYFLEVKAVQRQNGRRHFQIENGPEIVVCTKKGFAVKSLDELAPSGHFGSAARLVNFMSAYGFECYGHTIQDMLDFHDQGRFLFYLKVRRSFLRANREVESDSEPPESWGIFTVRRRLSLYEL